MRETRNLSTLLDLLTDFSSLEINHTKSVLSTGEDKKTLKRVANKGDADGGRLVFVAINHISNPIAPPPNFQDVILT